MPDVLMPRLSDTMEEGVLSRWLKQEGDQVHRGDIIAEIETDKAVMELEAYEEGELTRILVAEGTTVPIGTPVAVIGARAAAEQPREAPEQPQAPAPAPEPEPEATRPAVPPTPSAPPAPPQHLAAPTEIRTSPLARALAHRHGLDIAAIKGTGPGGRVVRADVDDAIAALARKPSPPQPPAAPPPAVTAPARSAPSLPAGEDSEEVPLTTVRRITAERLTQSTQEAPHFYLTALVDAAPLLAFRAEINAGLGEQGPRITVTDLLVKACAVTLRDRPELNASWDRTRILRHRRIHIGIAVALEDGLVVPVVHDADRETLTEIATEAHALADRARAGRLSVEEMTGGTFTISNLGAYGIDHFTAVINPPQAAILAVGAAKQQPVVRDGQVAVGTVMALTLSIDHRVVDGATGAVFLADLKSLLEQPLRIVL